MELNPYATLMIERFKPVKISFLTLMKILTDHCGNKHSLVLTKFEQKSILVSFIGDDKDHRCLVYDFSTGVANNIDGDWHKAIESVIAVVRHKNQTTKTENTTNENNLQSTNANTCHSIST